MYAVAVEDGCVLSLLCVIIALMTSCLDNVRSVSGVIFCR
jgi:hypothetical protein